MDDEQDKRLRRVEDKANILIVLVSLVAGFMAVQKITASLQEGWGWSEAWTSLLGVGILVCCLVWAMNKIERR